MPAQHRWSGAVPALRYLRRMLDLETASVLATGAGTLALAVATFGAVRSANRSARVAERALLAGQRPLVMPSRPGDDDVKVLFVDDYHVAVRGGRGTAERVGDVIYLTISLRNVGSGIAVLDGWHLQAWVPSSDDHPPVEEFRRLRRDIYVPAGDTGFWQGALRGTDDPDWAVAARCIEQREPFMVDLLYTDHDGGQRCISRMTVRPHRDGDWLTSGSRHWHLDGPSREREAPGRSTR